MGSLAMPRRITPAEFQSGHVHSSYEVSPTRSRPWRRKESQSAAKVTCLFGMEYRSPCTRGPCPFSSAAIKGDRLPYCRAICSVGWSMPSLYPDQSHHILHQTSKDVVPIPCRQFRAAMATPLFPNPPPHPSGPSCASSPPMWKTNPGSRPQLRPKSFDMLVTNRFQPPSTRPWPFLRLLHQSP